MMQQVILQPCADPTAQANYQRTIEHYVSLGDIKPYLTPEQEAKVKALYPGGMLQIWGVNDGKNEINRRKWQKIKRGDVVFFAWESTMHSSASVTYTFDNEVLSKYLWHDSAFHNIYLVDDFARTDLSYKQFNKIAGYKENFSLRGFQRINEEASARVLDYFALGDTDYAEEISPADCSARIQKVVDEESLDQPTLAQGRKEQRLLRSLLFGKAQDAVCALCGKKYPVGLMTAAHIKRRAECTLEERKDVPAIAMPACKFGCDELYERGYLLVDEGKVKLNPNKRVTDTIRSYVDSFIGRPCPYWNDATKTYFAAHNAKFKL